MPARHKGQYDGTPGPGAPKGRTQIKRPQQLKDMQHVYATEKEGRDNSSDTPGQATQRKFLRESPERFMALMDRMMTEYQKRKEKADKEAAAGKPKRGPSEGTEPITDLIGRLLNEFHPDEKE